MPSLSEILNDPNYVNANEETKAAIFTKYAPQDENYTKANAATQAAIRGRFGVEGQPGIGAQGGFDTALYSGYQGLKGGLAGLAGRIGMMDVEKAKQIQEEAEEKGKKAFKPTEGGWTTDFTGKFAETLGQSVPYMFAPIAAAGVATVAGAPGALATGISGLASAIQFAGSNLQRQQEQGIALEDTNLTGAIATAIPQAALETLSFRMIPGVQRLFGKAGKEITEAQAAEIAKQGIVRSTAAYGAQGARTGGVEGMTEVGQQFLERLQAGLTLGDQDAVNEFVESFIGGAVLGGTLAIPGTAMRRDQARQMAAQAPVAPETIETAPEVAPSATPEQIVVPESESQRTDVMMAELEGRTLPVEEVSVEPAPVAQPAQPAQVAQTEDVQPTAEDIVPLDDKGEPVTEPLTPADLDKIPAGAGFAEATPELKAEVAALEQRMKRLGLDTEAIIDDVNFTRATIKPLTEAQYFARLKSAYEQEISKFAPDPNIEAQLAAEPFDPESVVPLDAEGKPIPPEPKVEKVRQPKAVTPPRTYFGTDDKGNLNVPLDDGGIPFKTRKEAQAAKKLQPSLTVIPRKDGFVLAEKTEKQIAADKIKTQRLKAGPQGVLSAHEFIASLGGLNKKEASEIDKDAVKSNIRVGNKYLYSDKGMSIAEATEKLQEAGYIDSDSSNAGYQVIADSLVDPVYSINDADVIAERKFAERAEEDAAKFAKKEKSAEQEALDVGRENAEFQDYLTLERELADPESTMLEAGYTPAELQEAGFMDASIDLQTEVAALQDLATPDNIDALNIIDSLEPKTAQTAEEKVNAEEKAIATEITQAAQPGGRADVGKADETQGAETKEPVKTSALTAEKPAPDAMEVPVSRPPKATTAAVQQPVKPTWDSPDLTWKDSFIRKIADRNVDLKVVQNEISNQIGNLRDNVNAYQIEDQSHGRIQSQTADFLDYEFRPILKEMIANNVSDAELTKYLWMRHAPEANKVIAERNINNPDKQYGGSGVETDVALRYMATLPADKKKKLESLAKQVDNILALTREQLEKNGIISKEEREAWESMFENYVPLKREESDYALPTSTYRGVGPFSKSRTGSTSKNVIDILANVAINREIAIMRIEKERVKRAIYGLAVTNPNAGFWKAVSPDAVKNKQQLENELVNMGIDPKEVDNIFSEPKTEYFNKTTGQVESRVDQQKRYADYVLPVKIDGKDRFIFFNPKDERAMMMVTALKGLDTKPLSDFAAAMAPITRWFAAVNTQYNLIFGLWNFARDLQGAVFNLTTTPLADKKAEVIKGALAALPELYREARTRGKGGVPASMSDGSVQDFVASGGKIGGRERFAEYDKSAQIVEKELSKLNRGNVKKAAYATLDWISNVNDMLENAVRLSAYRSGLKAGMSKQQAADIAKNITVNFNRKGTVANNVGALYAFFNASVQGTARLAQTVDPRTKRGQKIMASLVGLGVVQAVALAMAGFDEDEPSEFLKQKNLIVPLGDKKYFMWPMPFGFNVFPNIGRLLFEGSSQAIRGKGVKDTVANMGSMLLNSFNPIGGGGVLQGLSPTAADPIVAIYQNRDAFDRPIAKEDQRSSPTPGFTRSRDPSASISQFISQLLNTASGGTNYSKGLVSPTADQINYLAEQVGGGVYREVSRIVRYAGEKARGDETPEYRVPIVGKLVGSTDSPAAISQKFYNNVVKMSEHEDEIKGRIKDRQSSSQYMRDNPEAALWRRANTLENDLTKINKQRKELIARDAPKEQLKRLDDQKTRMMKRFNDDVKKREATR
jgi:hypothetical protein